MKTFTVEKETIKSASRYPVASDGTITNHIPWDFEYVEPQTIGFFVQVFDGNEYEGCKFYPVYENESEVLEQIKADFPPDKYQNNEW